MTIFIKEDIVCQTTAVYYMLGLLADICFMGLQIEITSTASEFICSMIFQADTAEMSRTVISSESECIHIQFSQFRETVTVSIVRISVSIRLIQCYTVCIVRRYERGIRSHILFPRFSTKIGHIGRNLK